LLGFAWLTHAGEFDMLYVAPAAQRRGLALQMIRQLEETAAQAGVVALHAWASHVARPVFEQAGYAVLQPNTVTRDGETLENWLMAKGGWQEPASKERIMSPELVINLVQNALYILIIVSAPVLLVSLVVGLLVSVLQAATQINEMTLTFIPKLLAMFLVLVLAGPWMLNTLVEYTTRLFQSIPSVIG
jgi:flagellar biosynthetic protein FliQ